MTASAYLDAMRDYRIANDAWELYVTTGSGDEKAVLDALIAAASLCGQHAPTASDRRWYDEKHMMAIARRAKCA